MNYEERYNQALERAKKVHDGELTISPNEVNDFNVYEYIFPELRESEDEKIRKDLITYINSIKGDTLDLTMRAHKWLCWLEKQGEQKPADKVEPKFKIGDWITNGKYTWKVTDIKPLDYILQSQNGDTVDDTISYVDEEFHIWTIQDAKDGDVLAAHECLVLFKEIDGLNIRCYCTYHYLNSESFYIDTLQNKAAFQPATKEQCNILFQKMKEEGYVWYAEKKELMKIKQKHDDSLNEEDYGIDGLWHAQRILEKTLGEVDGYQTDDGILEHKCAIAAVKKLSEQKPSWNEEDEKMYNMFRSMAHGTYVVQTQETIDSLLSWLKSLKPQNRWKPSEEQMDALNKAVNNPANYHDTKLELQSLYNDLKNL